MLDITKTRRNGLTGFQMMMTTTTTTTTTMMMMMMKSRTSESRLEMVEKD
jgi:hypothetical protein